MIPYDDIIETADRGWTFRLLERLVRPELDDSELDDIVEALQVVSDRRAVGPLEAILCDTSRRASLRKAASNILRDMHDLALDVTEESLCRWWQGTDAILRRHAFLCMDRIDCPDIVLQVAKDPAHEFHADALDQMMFLFDEPEHEKVKIAGLSHPDAKVREAAAIALLYDEPIQAEAPLIEATSDPVLEVAIEAINTLQYYPSLRVIRCLHGLLNHPDEKVRDQAKDSFHYIRDEVAACSVTETIAWRTTSDGG